MAWTRHGIRRPRRRREDWQPLPPQSALAPVGRPLAESPAADPWPALNREIDRCRRYRHPVALVRVTAREPSGPTPPAVLPRREGRPSRRRREPLAELAAMLTGTVRSGDTTWTHGTGVYVLAPETDGVGAEAMAGRIRVVAAENLGVAVEVRIAAFPEDGLTGHALRASLTARTRRFRPAAGPTIAPGGATRTAWAGVPHVVDEPETAALRRRAD